MGVACALLAGILAIGGLASYWATDEILSSNTWERTSKAIVSDPAVQQDVASAISEQIIEAVGLQSIISGLLPGVASGFAGPLADRAQELLTNVTVQAVRTDVFVNVWQAAVRSAHDEFVHAIDGTSGVTSLTSRGLELDLAGVIGEVQKQLDQRGIRVLDSVDASKIDISFLLVDAPGLDALRSWVKVLRVLVIVLPALAVILAIAAFVVARRRWYAVAALGAGGLLGAGLVALVESMGRDRAVDELSGGVIGTATAAVVVDHIVAGLDGAVLVASAVSLAVLIVGIMGVVVVAPRRAASRTAA